MRGNIAPRIHITNNTQQRKEKNKEFTLIKATAVHNVVCTPIHCIHIQNRSAEGKGGGGGQTLLPRHLSLLKNPYAFLKNIHTKCM